jgi:hypothetical protein
VYGRYEDTGSNAYVHVGSVRSTWAAWSADTTSGRHHYRRKRPDEWLRRIATDPDAGPELRAAALDQLKNMTTTMEVPT